MKPVGSAPSPPPDSPLAPSIRERLLECVHCGLCLNACPTYLELGVEADSPRGRIHLLRAVADGTQEWNQEVAVHLDRCLGCLACERSCPSGVRYGEILEDARRRMRKMPRLRSWSRRLRAAGVRMIFPYRTRTRLFLAPLRLADRTGFGNVVRRLVPKARLVPPISRRPRLRRFYPAEGAERRRVALFLGCAGFELQPEIAAATVKVLNRNGVAVRVPSGQGCCGALALHEGDVGRARAFARANIEALCGHDPVVVGAAGCGAVMKRYGELLAGDPSGTAAREFAQRVRDVTELVAEHLHVPPRPLPLRVVYHEACHLVHAQQVHDPPRRILRAIPGLELVPLAESDVCCGSAGSYNLTEPELARRLGLRKARHVAASGAQCVAVANPGCAAQIGAALRELGSPVRVAHPVELLAQAYGAP